MNTLTPMRQKHLSSLQYNTIFLTVGLLFCRKCHDAGNSFFTKRGDMCHCLLSKYFYRPAGLLHRMCVSPWCSLVCMRVHYNHVFSLQPSNQSAKGQLDLTQWGCIYFQNTSYDRYGALPKCMCVCVCVCVFERERERERERDSLADIDNGLYLHIRACPPTAT